MKIIETKQDFDGLVSSQDSVIQFSASWCGPCKTMFSTLQGISKVFPLIQFGKFDIESDRTIAEKYNVSSVPTTVFFRDGKEVGRKIGNQPSQKIVQVIKDTF